VITTKVVNKIVIGGAALILLLAGIFPKVSAVLTTVPQCVLGGATISVFASIAMTGIKLLTSKGIGSRDSAIVGLAVALGMGLTQVPHSLAMFPESITMIFAKTPIVVATIVAILLNIILPKDKEENQ
ncbi:MAG: solute carrier family 23 protein, partial [Oscillospiraceae bacterium]